MKLILAVFFIFSCTVLSAQNWYSLSSGLKVSLQIAIGSHRNNIGVKVDSYLAIQNTQLNANTSFRYFGTNLGDRCHFGEIRSQLGLVAIWGKPRSVVNMDWDGALHQSRSPYSLGYAYLWYWDKVGTTQRSGTWNIGLNRIDIQFENDVFGGQAKDRYRTGALGVSYRDSLRKASIALVLWTGETSKTQWNHIQQDHMPNGFRDLTNRPYGYLNHGILYFELKQLADYKQTAGVRIGMDSEQIRHVFQNRISHDLVWLPKKMERNTPHYPRLNDSGENVFSRKEARKSTFYFSAFLNDGLFY